MSTPRLESCIPLPLGDDVLEEIVDKARDWALMHGAAMRSKDNFSKDLLQLAPFVLLPSPFPRKEFEKAVSIQPILNELMHKVAHSHDFLVASLKSTIEVDEFTRKLFEIYETVNREGVSQSTSQSSSGCVIGTFWGQPCQALFGPGVFNLRNPCARGHFFLRPSGS
uniref:Glutathione synthetase n=1 Tax=Timema genevievae TaxID=629358 RepID=A0A7R9PRG7_TIMGE|nr:unnamed protein product [Timema genevievae]